MKRLAFGKSKSEFNFQSANSNAINNLLSRNTSDSKDERAQGETSSNTFIKGGKSMLDDSIVYTPNCDPSVWMRSCEHEVIVPIRGKISGTIPRWLKGTLLRNGPGSLKVGECRFDHLFDCSALLHRFEITNGTVTYQNRFVRTDVFNKNRAAQRIVITEFGTKAIPDPCQSIFQRIAAVFDPSNSMSDNSMITVYPFGDEYYTFTEAPFVHRIDPKTLETMGKIYVSQHVGIINHSAHPHLMSDGSVYNIGLSITAYGPAYNIVHFSPNNEDREEPKRSMFERAKIVATAPSRWILNPSYMHTFGITENYFIIVEQPLATALVTLLSCQIQNEPLFTSLKWHEGENTLIHVISRSSNKVEKTFVAEAFFFLHIINQFEVGDREYIILDICCYRDAKMLDCMYIDVLKNLHKNPNYSELFRGRPLRFILPMRDFITGDIYRHSSIESLEQNLEFIMESASKNSKMYGCRRIYACKDDLNRKASAHRLPDGNIFVRPELLCNLGCETPRLNASYLRKQYRYFYAISSDVDLDNPGTLIKVDTVEKKRKTWCEKNAYPSEPIFVPDPNGENEDDGIVLSVLLWVQDRETEVGLLVLDAVTFEEIARACFDTPGPVPKCLHGWFTQTE